MRHITPTFSSPLSLTTGKSGGPEGSFYFTVQEEPILPLPLYTTFPSFFECSNLFDVYLPAATPFSH